MECLDDSVCALAPRVSNISQAVCIEDDVRV